jgi:4-hydroxy-4-methyl-2-oxoglutarate aldolase
MADANLTERLLALDTPSLSDALDKLGRPGAVVGLASLTLPARIAGRVQTVKLGAPIPNLPKVHLGAGAIMAAAAGDIIVVEHRGRIDVSGWGGLLSRASVKKGIAGVIVDGAFRDIDEARDLGLPVFGKAAVPVTARGRVAEHAFNQPITVAGIAVSPGDWVMGDGSGIVFLPQADAETILVVAEDIFRREQAMARDIDAGVPIDQVMGANYEDMLKKDG